MGRAHHKEKEECTNRGVFLRNLKRLRLMRALTQRQLGERAGISSGTVFRLESLRRTAYSVTVRKLAEALEVSPAELMRENHPGQEAHVDR